MMTDDIARCYDMEVQAVIAHVLGGQLDEAYPRQWSALRDNAALQRLALQMVDCVIKAGGNAQILQQIIGLAMTAGIVIGSILPAESLPDPKEGE